MDCDNSTLKCLASSTCRKRKRRSLKWSTMILSLSSRTSRPFMMSLVMIVSLLLSINLYQDTVLFIDAFLVPHPPVHPSPSPFLTTCTRTTMGKLKTIPTTTKASLSAMFSTTKSSSTLSQAAKWHQKRRQQILSNSSYSTLITPLERQSHGLYIGLPLLLLSNISLSTMAILSSMLDLTLWQIFALAFFPGSMFSLWQLQITHDCLHGSLLPKQYIHVKDDHNNREQCADDTNATKHKHHNIKNILSKKYHSTLFNTIVRNRTSLHHKILFWCTMPNAFGYYLYLKYGHISHHKHLGDENKSNLHTLFTSKNVDFEDGDALFVSHRMKLKGEVGPKFQIKIPRTSSNKKTITMSISNTGFKLWKDDHPIRNAFVFTMSFLLERMLLVMNDLVVAIMGRNYFFPNKPQEGFHDEVTKYCRMSCLVKIGLIGVAKILSQRGSVVTVCKFCWWKVLLFLYLAETLWSIPPHPACAMFITNHGSNHDGNHDDCVPSSSTYAGKLYSLFTLGTNYHVEHHDFPTIPLHELGKLRQIAPEFYRGDSNINVIGDIGSDGEGGGTKMKKDNVFQIMKRTFAKPEFYACMDAGMKIN